MIRKCFGSLGDWENFIYVLVKYDIDYEYEVTSKEYCFEIDDNKVDSELLNKIMERS